MRTSAVGGLHRVQDEAIADWRGLELVAEKTKVLAVTGEGGSSCYEGPHDCDGQKERWGYLIFIRSR